MSALLGLSARVRLPSRSLASRRYMSTFWDKPKNPLAASPATGSYWDQPKDPNAASPATGSYWDQPKDPNTASPATGSYWNKPKDPHTASPATGSYWDQPKDPNAASPATGSYWDQPKDTSLAADLAAEHPVETPNWYAKPKLSPKPKASPPRASLGEVGATRLHAAQPGKGQWLEQLKEGFDQAAEQHAQLQAQLLAKQEQQAEQTQLIAQSLAAAASERSELQGKVDGLYQDLHALTAQMLKEQVGVRERVQRKGVKGRGGQSRMAYRPTIANAEKQPTHVCEMSHQSLAELAMLGNHCSRRERLLREIMAVEGISWGSAHKILNELDAFNERYYWIESMPYRIGITAAFLGAILGSMMVFYKPVALWYGEQIAGEELPEGVKDISELTTNQVGSWTWGWMEPMIGVASFVLLCAQFGRAQVMKMNMKTYADQLLGWRANRLASKFPAYDGSMVRAWAKHMPAVGMNMFPIYERRAGYKGFTSGL